MRKNRLLIVLFTGVAVLLSLASCTYDYFEDETNYQVFVPEVLNKTVSDCRVLVYNDAGTLVGARYATSPWDKDPRMEAGLFSFRLTPGEYKVYCYTNTDSLTFVDGQHLDASAFILKSSSTGPNRYVQPSDILFQKFVPAIVHPGILQTDTAALERYTGRITVRFKKFPGDVSHIKKVQLLAEGAPVMQYLKNNTLTGRLTPEDKMFHFGTLPVQEKADVLEVDHRFIPSVENEPMRLNYTFLDENGAVVNHLPVRRKDETSFIDYRKDLITFRVDIRSQIYRGSPCPGLVIPMNNIQVEPSVSSRHVGSEQ